jgi:hypothetical protein
VVGGNRREVCSESVTITHLEHFNRSSAKKLGEPNVDEFDSACRKTRRRHKARHFVSPERHRFVSRERRLRARAFVNTDTRWCVYCDHVRTAGAGPSSPLGRCFGKSRVGANPEEGVHEPLFVSRPIDDGHACRLRFTQACDVYSFGRQEAGSNWSPGPSQPGSREKPIASVVTRTNQENHRLIGGDHGLKVVSQSMSRALHEPIGPDALGGGVFSAADVLNEMSAQHRYSTVTDLARFRG